MCKCFDDKEIVYLVLLIVLHFIDLSLFIVGLLVIKWHNILKVNLILFIIFTSMNFLYFFFAIFLFISYHIKSIGECGGKKISLFCFISLFLIFWTDFAEICIFASSIDKVNYPCQKEDESNGTGSGYTYHYVYYYYLRRLTSDFDCTDLPEDYYTGIVTKKESKIAYAALVYCLVTIIFKAAFWWALRSKIDERRCDCGCKYCCDCDCKCDCCFSLCHKKEEVDIKKNEPNNIGNNQRVNVEVAIQNSNETLKEK